MKEGIFYWFPAAKNCYHVYHIFPGIPSTPTQGAWLTKTLPFGSRVGVDPKLLSKEQWSPLSKLLVSSGHSLIPVERNLVDALWDEKPHPPHNAIEPLGMEFTGKSSKNRLLSPVQPINLMYVCYWKANCGRTR